jgi:phosphatidylglycerol---prolipoprotein diacylglyceryl transferase
MIITWTANPEIITLGPITLRWYGLLFAIGFLMGFKIMEKIFKKENISLEHLDALLLYLIAGTTIGARLGHCLFYDPEIYLRDPIRILYIWEGGLASHGGTLGNLIAMILYSRRFGYDLRWLVDRLTIPLALGSCFIRLGNLMNSEILGKPTDGSWGIIFAKNNQLSQVPRHPSMLYESFMYFLIFWIMRYLYNKTNWPQYKGRMWGLFFILVFGSRFFIEFFKENQDGFDQTLQTINMGQYLSIPFVIAGIILMVLSRNAKIEPAPTKKKKGK